MTPTDARLALLRHGYSPLPLNGKAPTPKSWEQKIETNPAEIHLWDTMWPRAVNTGILTRFTPCLDIDILNQEAAEAVEALVRERFEDGGYILIRIGKAPKRAIPFRTREPFTKIAVSLIAPNGDPKKSEKLEFLGDGQQVVVDGIHPDINKPYTWFGKSLLDVPHDELPYIRAAEAQQLIDDAVELLVSEHDYKRAETKKGNGDDPGGGEPIDWANLTTKILAGQELHDSTRDMAASFIGSGMSAAHALRVLRMIMLASTAPHDERWKERLDNLPRLVREAEGKFGKPPPPRERLLQSSAEFVKDFVPPDYLIDGIIQRRFLYAFTGKTGSGKTALALLLAACVALGRALGNLRVRKGRVIYLCGENPDDVRMRWIGLATEMQFAADAVEVYFIPGRFRISEMLDRIAKEVAQCGDAALVIIDTSAAYYEGDEVNSNTQQGDHARRLRKLVTLPGGPSVLVLCHPVKNAAHDNLLPLGAGAFLNEVDGNLTCAIDNSIVEVHWQGKFRGPDFSPIEFKVYSVTDNVLKDSEGRTIPTVVAAYLSDAEKEEIKRTARSNEDTLLAVVADNGKSSWAELATLCQWFLSDGTPHKTKVRRTLDKLVKQKLITADERDGVELTDKGEKALASSSAKPAKPAKAAPAAKAKAGFAIERVGPAPPGTCCVECHGLVSGEIAKWRDKRRPRSQPDILHEGCARAWFGA
jgi:AAA domain/Bifunctional DNA primase/polymerase, N-terminal